MTGANKVAGLAAALLLSFTLTAAPAQAQFGGGGDMMTQMAPMLEMMKAKMGKRRFAKVMQAVGPMMSGMMESGGGGSYGGVEGSGGMMGGGGYGSYASLVSSGYGAEMMTMAPQLVQMGRSVIRHRHHLRRHLHRY
jgi:hypothetical protein